MRKGGYTPVEVVEARQEVEAEFHKALLLVSRQRAEDFSSVVHVVLVSYPVQVFMNVVDEHAIKRHTSGHYSNIEHERGRSSNNATH